LPAPTDMLLHLVGHLVLQHPREERLIWVADIDRLVRSVASSSTGQVADDTRRGGAGGSVLDAAVERAAQAGLAGALEAALRAARWWFATPVPAETLDALTSIAESPAARRTHAALRRRAPVGLEGARLLSDVRGLVGWRARLGFAARHALPPPDYMRAWYGVDRPAMLPIYYARRLARGLLHIAVERVAPRGNKAAADEPPESWMIKGGTPRSGAR